MPALQTVRGRLAVPSRRRAQALRLLGTCHHHSASGLLRPRLAAHHGRRRHVRDGAAQGHRGGGAVLFGRWRFLSSSMRYEGCNATGKLSLKWPERLVCPLLHERLRRTANQESESMRDAHATAHGNFSNVRFRYINNQNRRYMDANDVANTIIRGARNSHRRRRAHAPTPPTPTRWLSLSDDRVTRNGNRCSYQHRTVSGT
jgi:hypothetical protein